VAFFLPAELGAGSHGSARSRSMRRGVFPLLLCSAFFLFRRGPSSGKDDALESLLPSFFLRARKARKVVIDHGHRFRALPPNDAEMG